MEKTKYLIGDIANLMGVSRDTLRYYEKRGILNSQKGDNGYRYYTDQDISRLIGILYQRKMNISLGDIETLWNGDTFPQLSDIMENRLKEEEQAIRLHRQTIARLRLTKEDCRRIHESMNQVAIQDFPCAYIIVPETTIEDSAGLWFQLAQSHPGLDMMYMFDEYTCSRPSAELQLEYKNTQLILYRDLAEYVDYNILDGATPLTRPAKCLHTYCTSKNRIPRPEDILPMFEWAQKRRLTLSDKVYSTYAFQGVQGGQHTYFMEIYIPLA